MTSNTNLVSNIVTDIVNSTFFDNCKIVEEFVATAKNVPLKVPTIAVSIKKCEISERLVNEDGTVSSKRDVLSSVGTDIYLPLTINGSTAFSIFDKIATLLVFSKKYNIVEATFDNLRYDSKSQAIILPAQFIFKHTVSA